MALSTAEKVDPTYAKVRVDAIDAKVASMDEERKRLVAQRDALAKFIPKTSKTSD